MSTPSGFEVFEILALQGKDLPNKDYWKKQDPFLQYEIGSQLKRTRVDKKGGRNPEWNQRTRFDRLRAPIPGNMKVKCYDDDIIGKPKFIGECVIDLSEIYSEGDMDNWFTLYDAGEKAGQIYLEMTFFAPDGVTRRRKVLDEERRANRRKTKGSRSGSEDSLASQVDKLELAGPPVVPIKADLKPGPKAEANVQHPSPTKEASVPKPQEFTPTAPQTTSPVLSQNQYPDIDVPATTTPSTQVNSLNIANQVSILPSTNPVIASPTSISQPAPNPSIEKVTANDATKYTPAHVLPPIDQSKAPTESVLQNHPITSAPHVSTAVNTIASHAISSIKPDSLSNVVSQPTTSIPIQVSTNPVAAPVLTSEPITTSSVSSLPSNSTPAANAASQPVNQQAHTNSIESGHSQAVPNSETHSNSMGTSMGSHPSTYADNATSASPYPQISAPKPFTYGNIQPTPGSQTQQQSQSSQNMQSVSIDHTQAQPALVANQITAQPIQNSQEQTHNNTSQPSNQGIASSSAPGSQSKPIEQHPAGTNIPNIVSASIDSQSEIYQHANQQAQPAQSYPTNPSPTQSFNPSQSHSTYETQSPVASQLPSHNITIQPTQASQYHSINPATTQESPCSQSTNQANTQEYNAYNPQSQSNAIHPTKASQVHSTNTVTTQSYPPPQNTHQVSTPPQAVPQSLVQHVVPQPAQVSQPTNHVTTQTYPSIQSNATHGAQPTSTQVPWGPQQLDQHIVFQHPQSNPPQPNITTQPQQYPNSHPQTYPPVSAPHPTVTAQPHSQQHHSHTHSNSFSSANSYQTSLPAIHQYPPQSYPASSSVSVYSPTTAHQPYIPAPYPPPQPYHLPSYSGYPSTNEAHYNPYPQPQEASARPLFPSVTDHVYDQPYQQTHFTHYPTRQDSYPQTPSHTSSGSQYYPPGPSDPYSSYSSSSYHRPTSFPSFPSAYSDNPSSPPPLPNKPIIPDTYVTETPPPLPSRPPTMTFPALQANNIPSPPINTSNPPINTNNQNQAYSTSGIPYGSQTDPDKKKNKSDYDKLKKMFKQFI